MARKTTTSQAAHDASLIADVKRRIENTKQYIASHPNNRKGGERVLKSLNRELREFRALMKAPPGLLGNADAPYHKRAIPCHDYPLNVRPICRIVETGQYGKIARTPTDRVNMDLFTANAIMKVYDALNQTNREKIASRPMRKMARVAFQLCCSSSADLPYPSPSRRQAATTPLFERPSSFAIRSYPIPSARSSRNRDSRFPVME